MKNKIPIVLMIMAVLAGSSSIYAAPPDTERSIRRPAVNEAQPSVPSSSNRNRAVTARQKACQAKEVAINQKMTKLAERAHRQVEVFDSISERTQQYYEEKGRVVTNYSKLVAEINAAKAKVHADLATMDSSSELNCNDPDPKARAQAFKSSLKTLSSDLKAYKTAVRNLIAAVKSVQETAI